MKGQIQPEDSRHISTGMQANDFLTFDLTHKHLVRVVEVKGKHLIVCRFDKRSVEWRTKLEKLGRNAGIVLSPEEAEKGFPGCLAAWERVAQSSLPRSGGKVSRQMSPNSSAPVVAAPILQSVSDFLAAYDDTKKTIDDLTNKFVDKAGEAKKAQDDILPHLAYMQSLLSKKGPNHHLVIAARKQGKKIPWWTEYYKSYKGKLWESLRTMERRIAAYRRDPSIPRPDPPDPPPHLNKAARKALIEGNHRAVEIVAALEAGRDAKKEIADFKAVMNAKRLDDIMETHEVEPDYKGILQRILHLVKENEASLPADFVMAVKEVAEGGTAASANDEEWSCSICGDSISSTAHQEIEDHFLAHFSDEPNSGASVGT